MKTIISATPWKIEPGAIVDANKKLVCIPIQGSHASANPANNYTVPEVEANRRLIAAAPDLLWALHACLADLQDITSAEGGDESEAMKQARAAIAQVEGGEQ